MSNPARGRILLALNLKNVGHWGELLGREREVTTQRAFPVDPSIDYAVVWKHSAGALAGLPNLKLIISMGAGVDHIFTYPDLPDVPVLRVVAANLTTHMVEYVVWRVMDHHRQGTAYRAQQAGKLWHEHRQKTASEVAVGIMGLGQLGGAAAKALLALGFRVNGWTRNPRAVEGVATFHGQAGLKDFLAATDILVVLLPHTPATEGIIDYDLLRGLNRDNALGGAVLVNAGRGRLQKEDDILRALDDGTLKEASLDVFETEPLPASSPLWSHPRVFITPHASATSDPIHLVPLMLEQMDRFERGEPLANLVDRNAGY